MNAYRYLLLFAILQAMLCLCFKIALAHNWDKNNIVLFANIEITEDRLALGLSVPGDLLNQLLTHPLRFELVPTIEQQKQLKQELLDYFHRFNPIFADTQRLKPQIKEVILILTAQQALVEQEQPKMEGLSMHKGTMGAVLVMLEYPFEAQKKGGVKEITIQWNSDILWLSLGKKVSALSSKVMTAIISDGDALQFLRLTRDEPEYIWHRPNSSQLKSSIKVDSKHLLSLKKGYQPPVLSYFLLILAIISLRAPKALFQLRYGYLSKYVIFSLLILGAYMSWHIRPLSFQSAQLSMEEKEAIFKQKHQGIYDAFAQKSEGHIYDALSRQAHGDLLDQIYQSTYQSLIVPEENGAKSTIKQIKYIKLVPLALNSKDGFRWRVTWQVFGEINHWGHHHQRVNEYTAEYEMNWVNDDYYITSIDVLSQQRKTELEKNTF